MAQDSGLGEMFLNGSAEKLGIRLPEEPWLVVMEKGVKGGSYTAISIYDGTTSLYFSNGGGTIGAGGHPEVAEISKSIVASISDFESQFSPVETAEKRPDLGRTAFYYRHGSTLHHIEVAEDELGNNNHPLSALFYCRMIAVVVT